MYSNNISISIIYSTKYVHYQGTLYACTGEYEYVIAAATVYDMSNSELLPIS